MAALAIASVPTKCFVPARETAPRPCHLEVHQRFQLPAARLIFQRCCTLNAPRFSEKSFRKHFNYVTAAGSGQNLSTTNLSKDAQGEEPGNTRLLSSCKVLCMRDLSLLLFKSAFCSYECCSIMYMINKSIYQHRIYHPHQGSVLVLSIALCIIVHMKLIYEHNNRFCTVAEEPSPDFDLLLKVRCFVHVAFFPIA